MFGIRAASAPRSRSGNLRCSSLTKLPELPEEDPDDRIPDERALEAEPADNELENRAGNTRVSPPQSQARNVLQAKKLINDTVVKNNSQRQ